MNDKININELRKWFNNQKELHGWSYAELGRIDTGYKESGLKTALKNNTVKYEALMAMIKAKNLTDSFNKHFNTIAEKNQNTSKKTTSLKDACHIVASNPHEAMEDVTFKNFVVIQALKLIRAAAKDGNASVDDLLDSL